MSKIAKNLTDLIGNTPLLELSNFNVFNNLDSKLVAKLVRQLKLQKELKIKEKLLL